MRQRTVSRFPLFLVFGSMPSMKAILVGASLSWMLWGCGAPSPGPEAKPVSDGVGQGEVVPAPPAPPDPAASASVATAEPVSAPTVAPEASPPGWQPIPAKRPKGFPGVPFAEVRAFAFDLENGARPICSGPLDEDGTLCSTVARPGVKLSAEQAKKLVALVQQKSSFGGGSKCFLPHHGFVFYDEAGVPVADISVCFMCEMATSTPSIPAARPSGEGGGSVGISEKGVTALRALCNELGLPKCDAKKPNDFGLPPP
ncbi:MAG: hypothetical protein HOV80_07540 [Polyangiaceae bacterium]|nr:hypothetical protein [Polyangiaceae bacterium]